jgi:ribose 5-phosphate isomerase A
MASTLELQKQQVAKRALDLVLDSAKPDRPIGVGTGSTAECFIDLLGSVRDRFGGAVASSERSALRLESQGIRVLDLNAVDSLTLYVDGADELTADLALVKGGGGALTREKIVAAVAERFICIADSSKLVARLGGFPLPVEVIPMARAYVERALLALCGPKATVRQRGLAAGNPFKTDNGNVILDVAGLEVADPLALEAEIESIVGVVASGLFARRRADVVLLGGAAGVRELWPGASPDWDSHLG